MSAQRPEPVRDDGPGAGGGPVLHVVLMRLAPETTPADVAALDAAILGLRATIPGIRSIAVGPSSSPEGLEHGYDRAFVVTFTDRRARDAYLPNPDHLAVSARIQAAATDVLVFDL